MSVAVRFENVGKRFPNGVEAVRGVDIAFEPGRVTVVLGPSGAGKSTMLRLINGLETPTSGRILVGDLEVERRTFRTVRQQVGMVFQQFNLVPRLTVMANVLCGRLAYRSWLNALFFIFPKSDFELAEQALGRVGLQDRAWDRADRLSGGQQQRVAIARTIVQEAKVILADEPVASLDPATSAEVMDLLVQMARERQTTLIVNLHQVELAKQYADRILGIQKGAVLFDVEPSDLTDERIQRLYGTRG